MQNSCVGPYTNASPRRVLYSRQISLLSLASHGERHLVDSVINCHMEQQGHTSGPRAVRQPRGSVLPGGFYCQLLPDTVAVNPVDMLMNAEPPRPRPVTVLPVIVAEPMGAG